MKKPNHRKPQFFTALLLLFVVQLFGQSPITGTVAEKNGTPVIGANIFVESSYDGTTSDENGAFSFTTMLEGEQTLLVTYIGYETKKIKITLENSQNLNITIRESALSLDAVEITASTFKAGDNSKLAVLKPLDVVTTAGSNGDVIAALQTLPGTSPNNDDGRLFVRGGDARETQIFINGLKVFSPYSRTIQGTPTRGRYSPFLFKGVSFSTGGYGAQFGQALSGILDMTTIDEVNETETNLSLMSVGLGIGHSQKWKNQSLSLSASYTDLTPYFWLVNSRANMLNPFRGFSGEAIYRNKTKKGLFKFYVAGDYQSIKLNNYDFESDMEQLLSIKNYNYYANTSYSGILDDKTSVFIGTSLGFNSDNTGIDQFDFATDQFGVHSKLSFKTIFNDHFFLNYGADLLLEFDELEQSNAALKFYEGAISQRIPAVFFETDYFFSKDLAVKVGLRGEYASLSNSYEVSPRLTIGQKLGADGQLSAAFGQFRQEVDRNYLFYEDVSLENEMATHYLVNYNLKTKKQLLRLEAYYKKYDHLLKFDSSESQASNLNSKGEGIAYGAEVFWRANQLLKNLDFWISYSYLNHERNYLDFPVAATPNFSTKHTLSLVAKRWFPEMKSQISFTYQFASGRPYENPNTTGFLNERSKPFNNMSLSWAYLISQQKILFVSVSNFPGFKNEYGYRYRNVADANGIYPSQLIKPNEDQFFFVGFFITMSPDKTKNQLDNL